MAKLSMVPNSNVSLAGEALAHQEIGGEQADGGGQRPRSPRWMVVQNEFQAMPDHTRPCSPRVMEKAAM
jgi:hypothetical protein